MAHQLTLLEPLSKAGDACICMAATYERRGRELVCPFCGFRPERLIVASWDPEARP